MRPLEAQDGPQDGARRSIEFPRGVRKIGTHFNAIRKKRGLLHLILCYLEEGVESKVLLISCAVHFVMYFTHQDASPVRGACRSVRLQRSSVKHLLRRWPSRGARYFPDALRVHQEGNLETGRCRKPRKNLSNMHIVLTSVLKLS